MMRVSGLQRRRSIAGRKLASGQPSAASSRGAAHQPSQACASSRPGAQAAHFFRWTGITPGARARISVQLLPPKPKEFVITGPGGACIPGAASAQRGAAPDPAGRRRRGGSGRSPRPDELLEHEPAEAGLHRPGRAQRVSHQRLGRATRRSDVEDARDRAALHLVVERGPGAVQVQVGDLLRRQAARRPARRASPARRRVRPGPAPTCGGLRSTRPRRRAGSRPRRASPGRAPSPRRA